VFGDEPEVFGDWLLVHRLAEGHMAEAMVALRLGDRSGRTYVVKRPRLGERPSGAAAQAIAREGEVLGAVRSPYLVALEAAGTVAGLPFVALEHVRGVPLDRLLTLAGALTDGEARAVASDVLAALGALHAAGWVHGDVAPSNVVVDDAGEARLLDLGIAARVGEVRAAPAGKPGYVAPEAIGRPAAAPSIDVYGWAVVTAECLLGRRLFAEHDLSEAATRDGAPPAVAQLDRWGPLLAPALGLDPSRRPTVAALRGALATAPIDRAALAATVARVRAAPERRSAPTPAPAAPRELTPTAPLVIQAAPVEARPAPPAPALGAPARRSVLLGALGAGLAGVLGWMVGRRGARRGRGASLGLSTALPARGRLEIDGRVIATPEPGKEIPVAPGRHTVTIAIPRREEQAFDVVVGDGEHLVLVVPPLGGARRERDEPARGTGARQREARP
jgi:serine/threonine-protein kinase